MEQMELVDHLPVCKRMNKVEELFVLKSSSWNRLTVCKQMINSKENYSHQIVILRSFTYVQISD